MRIDVVELGGLDECVDGGGAAAAFVGAREGPIPAADSDAAQRPLGGVVRHAQPTVVEEAGERGPALERVVDRLGGLALGGEASALTAQSSLQFGEQGPALLAAHAPALVDGASVIALPHGLSAMVL